LRRSAFPRGLGGSLRGRFQCERKQMLMTWLVCGRGFS
jgi:hypothetical protein